MLIYLPSGSTVNIQSVVTSSSPPSTSTNNVNGISTTNRRRMMSNGGSSFSTSITSAGTTLHTDDVSTNKGGLRRQLLTPTYLTVGFTVAAYVSSTSALTAIVQSSTTTAQVATTLSQYYTGIIISNPIWITSSPSSGCSYNNCPPGGSPSNYNTGYNGSPSVGAQAGTGTAIGVAIIVG